MSQISSTMLRKLRRSQKNVYRENNVHSTNHRSDPCILLQKYVLLKHYLKTHLNIVPFLVRSKY